MQLNNKIQKIYHPCRTTAIAVGTSVLQFDGRWYGVYCLPDGYVDNRMPVLPDFSCVFCSYVCKQYVNRQLNRLKSNRFDLFGVLLFCASLLGCCRLLFVDSKINFRKNVLNFANTSYCVVFYLEIPPGFDIVDVFLIRKVWSGVTALVEHG